MTSPSFSTQNEVKLKSFSLIYRRAKGESFNVILSVDNLKNLRFPFPITTIVSSSR
jgi:hypothetical protein